MSLVRRIIVEVHDGPRGGGVFFRSGDDEEGILPHDALFLAVAAGMGGALMQEAKVLERFKRESSLRELIRALKAGWKEVSKGDRKGITPIGGDPADLVCDICGC